MAKLDRRKVFDVILESSYGQDPGGTRQALLLREGANVRVNGEQVNRDTLRDTLSPRGHVIGLKDQQLTVPLELRGAGLDGGVLNEPELKPLLRASAMAQEDGARLALSGITGTFERGETVTNDTAVNAVGTVADWDSVNSVLYIRDLQNMPSDTDSISGDTSSASATVDSSDEAYVYRPESPNPENQASVYGRFYVAGIRHRIAGARATFSADLTVGQIPTISFTLNGIYEKPADDPNPSQTYLSLTPQPVFGANLILGSLDTSLVTVNQITADIGNDLQWRDDVQAASGRDSAIVGDRDPTGSIDPEAVALSNFDPYTDWENSNEVAVAAGIGSTQGERVRLVMPKTQYTELPYGERNGIVTYNIGFRATGFDDELMLIYS